MILSSPTGLEICFLNAAKKDDGPRLTKALLVLDKLKIAMFVKDIVDNAITAEELATAIGQAMTLRKELNIYSTKIAT
ncbi:hypothetical protein EC991_006543 [Linnemannia zychae]|nr:hypothetical protein EC991_006543 [Linnemannia zychae]